MNENLNVKVLESYVEIDKIHDDINNKIFNVITKANELVELSDDDYQIEKTLKLNKISLKGYVLDSDLCNQLNENNMKGEPSADLLVRSCSLHGTEIGGELIPTLIDELPIIAVLASYANGKTVIKDAQELKVKESNRIDVMVSNLSKMGVDIQATEDGMIIQGGKQLHGAVIDSKLDHRIAMSFAIAALQAEGETEILGSECVNISYPGFYRDLQNISQ